MGSTPDQAHLNIKLLMLVNDITLRNLAPDEQAGGYGFLQAKPAMACSPVAITPDELGDAWRGGKVHYALRCSLNGKLTGQPHAGADMAFNYPQLLAHLCQTRNARAGSVVSAGGVANKEVKKGFSSIVERRNQEMIADGVASTPFLLFGDVVRLEMLGDDGNPYLAHRTDREQAEARKSAKFPKGNWKSGNCPPVPDGFLSLESIMLHAQSVLCLAGAGLHRS